MATYYVKTTGNDTTGDGSSGNPWATPGKAAASMSAGDLTYVEDGTYTLSTSTPGAGGPVALPSGSKCTMEGYLSTPGDLGAHPVLSAGAFGSITLFTAQGTSSTNPHRFVSMKADGNGQSSVTGFNIGNERHQARLCVAEDCNIGFTGGGAVKYGCHALSCTTGFAGGAGYSCTAEACGTGFTGSDSNYARCLAFDCTGNGFSGSARATFILCTSRDNGADGFDINQSSACIDCVAVNNGGYGFDGDNSNVVSGWTYGNTSGPIVSLFRDLTTALSGDPATTPASDDFRPNDTAGAGAVIRSAAVALPTQTDNMDGGGLQHTDPAGGGGGGGRRPRLVTAC